MAFVQDMRRLPAGEAVLTADAALRRAFGLVLVAGVLGASGALFVILLYGRLIPAGSLAALGVACGLALLLIGLQGLARAKAGHLADEASQRIFARLQAEGEAMLREGQPLVRALRSRSFMVAADLAWVPVFLLAVLVLNPWMGLATGLALALVARWGAATEPPAPKPDARFRARERRRRLMLGLVRDGMQILLLSLGGALAIGGQMQIGEIVAATLLSLRALGAVSAAQEDAPALKAAVASWRALNRCAGPSAG